MDAVILYVNGDDPTFIKEWRNAKSKIQHIPSATRNCRIRDWGTLQYLLRSIDKFAPFIDKVHLVVKSHSQVPRYIDTQKVHIVLESEIIPQKYYPVFNSRSIEYFLHNISGLSEQFVYFNDDMLFFDKIKEEDLFVQGKPCYKLIEHEINDNANMPDLYYDSSFKNEDNARKAFEISNKKFDRWFELNHGCCPLLKSQCKKVYDILESEMDGHINTFRHNNDWYHSLYINYMYINGMTHEYDCPNRYYIFNKNVDEIYVDITHPRKIKQICINDVNVPDEKYFLYRKRINDALNMVFPEICKFEKCKCAICVVVKNENKYLKEFCEYHLLLGFDHIFVYDNNDIDGENPKDVLTLDCITVINCRGQKNCQHKVYNECYKKYGNIFDWIAFIDCDEFIKLQHKKSIKSFLLQDFFRYVDGIHLHWKVF